MFLDCPWLRSVHFVVYANSVRQLATQVRRRPTCASLDILGYLGGRASVEITVFVMRGRRTFRHAIKPRCASASLAHRESGKACSFLFLPGHVAQATYYSFRLSFNKISQPRDCSSGASSPAAFFKIQCVNRHLLSQNRSGLPPVRVRRLSVIPHKGLPQRASGVIDCKR
jgi:hypothetical protein